MPTIPSDPTDLARAVADAAGALAPYLPPTPARRSNWLSDELGVEVWLKLETDQPTGSFKVRGALRRLLAEDGPVHAVAASTGNHGAAVAWAQSVLGGQTTVFAPRSAARSKLARLERLGVEVRTEGDDCLEAEAAARSFADGEGAVYVSPYNDPLVVAGQGTLAWELEQQVPGLDRLYVALGGGGLLGGIACWVKRPGAVGRTELVGCSPERSKVMIESVRAGRILDLPSEETLSDGTAGGVEQGSVTFPLIAENVDELLTVPEDAIAASMRDCFEHDLPVEGAAAMAVAAARAEAKGSEVGRIGIVLCGANADRRVAR